MFRTVGPSSELRPALSALDDFVEASIVLDVPAVTLRTLPGFETSVFPFTTDIPFLSAWGTPLLYGPGSILVAHSEHEHVLLDDLDRAVDGYVELARGVMEC